MLVFESMRAEFEHNHQICSNCCAIHSYFFFSDNACVCVAKFEISDISDSKTCLNNIIELITY